MHSFKWFLRNINNQIVRCYKLKSRRPPFDWIRTLNVDLIIDATILARVIIKLEFVAHLKDWDGDRLYETFFGGLQLRFI